MRKRSLLFFGDKIGVCRNDCIDKLGKEEKDEGYRKQVEKVKELLDTLSAKYQENAEVRKNENCETDAEAAVQQNTRVKHELNEKIANTQKLIREANRKIESFDNKIFSLLLNTVAILGIFVAIAFTGFGVSSFFNSINLDKAMESLNVFIKNVFFIFLALLASYNLLLILVYFVFKLSRPLQNHHDERFHKGFSSSINLGPFWIVDSIILVITIILFIFSFIV